MLLAVGEEFVAVFVEVAPTRGDSSIPVVGCSSMEHMHKHTFFIASG